MTMTVDTSLEAWSHVKATLNKRHAQVLNTIQKYPDHTGNELSKIMRLPIQSVSGRLTELRDAGKIKRTGRRDCSVSGHSAYVWRAV